MSDKLKTTQHFKDEFILQKNSFIDFKASVIEFMMNPYRLLTPLQSVILVAAEYCVPEKDWSQYGVKPMYYWIFISLISEDEKNFIRDIYYRDFQLRAYRVEVTIVVKKVVSDLETKPYKLNDDRILTRVCGYITDIDIAHYDKYVPSAIRKVDIKDIILQLISYKLIPDIYIDAVRVLVEEIFESLQYHRVNLPPIVSVGSTTVLDAISVEKHANFPIVVQATNYESSLSVIVEEKALADEEGRPVIAEAVFFELEAFPDYPGIATPQVSDKLPTLDGLPQLPDSMKLKINELCGVYKNHNMKKIKIVVIGDSESYESFSEESQFSLVRLHSTPNYPYKDITTLFDPGLCDLTYKHRARGLVSESLQCYVSRYKKKQKKLLKQLSDDYHDDPTLRHRLSNPRDDGFRSKRVKYRDRVPT